MLFHEIYGAYFRSVSAILREAGSCPVNKHRMTEIVTDNAFAESTLVIPEKLASGEWPLLKETVDPGTGKKMFSSVLSGPPARPLTQLEKQWLKVLLEDPRIRLFLQEDSSLARLAGLLADVPALFDRDMFVYYDRYSDGDDFADEEYIRTFRKILRAMHEKRLVFIENAGRRRETWGRLYFPQRIEYSSKDDKFRLRCVSLRGTMYTINISRITLCEIRRRAEPEEMPVPAAKKAQVDLILTDERNALQRAMLHFSDLQKETERIDEKHYRIRLYYYKDDETELVIRILSFGPMLRVIGPDGFSGLIRGRIEKQEKLCGL